MDAENPYTVPAAELHDPALVRQPLYSLMAVGLATFIGSPLAGAYVLAQNLKTLGRPAEVATVWAIAVAVLVLTMVCAMLLPDEVPALPFTIVQIAIMAWLANSRIGPDLLQYVEKGGVLYSNWRAAGIALLFTLALIVLLVPVMLLFA